MATEADLKRLYYANALGVSASELALLSESDLEARFYSGSYSGGTGGGGAGTTADYLISKSGSTVTAVKVSDNSSAYSGTDAGAALTAAITALGTAGGAIAFRRDTYAWSSIPKLPVGLTGWLRILGNGSTITLNTTTGARFLDLDGTTAVNETFQRIEVDGFRVDGAALSAIAGNDLVAHVVIGNYGMSGGERRNIDNIRITNIEALNIPPASSTYDFLVIYIHCAQSASGQTNTIKRVHIENIVIDGGLQGVSVVGSKTGGYTGATNIFFDEIVIRNVRHDAGDPPLSFGSSSHIHVGSFGTCGSVLVENIFGTNSRDVGIEIDAAYNAVINNVFIENCYGYIIALANFIGLADPSRQMTTITNVHGLRTGGRLTQFATGLIGLVNDVLSVPANPKYGAIVAKNCSFTRTATAPTFNVDGIDGELLKAGGDFHYIELDGCKYTAIGAANAGTGSVAPAAIVFQDLVGTGFKRINIINCDIRWQGSDTSTGTSEVYGIRAQSSNINLSIHNTYVDFNWAPFTAGTQTRAVFLGATGVATTMRGTIRNLRSGGAGLGLGRAVMLVGSGTLTLTPAMRILDCDFVGYAAGDAIFHFDSAGVGNNTATKTITANNFL